MRSLPVSVAFSLSLVVGFAAAATVMPPIVPAEAASQQQPACASGGKAKGSSQGCVVPAASSKPSRDLSDCHRSVQTHKINGVMVKHRHVGPDCQIRVVGTSN